MSEKRRRRPVQVKRSRSSLKTILTLAACMMLVAVVSIGGTMAWLADAKQLTNTFTDSDISIELAETATDFKMVPGNTITKDPKITVKAGSEASWLFVKIDKSANYDNYLEDYGIAEGWGILPSENGVYYRQVEAAIADAEFGVLLNDEVKVKETVTKAQMNAISDSNEPTLTFTAYAVQYANVPTGEAAWEIAKGIQINTTP